MRHKNITAGLLLIIFFISANLSSAKEIQLSGYVRNYMGILTEKEKDGAFSIMQNTFNFNIEGSKNNIAFKVNPYVYQYNDSNELTFGLREAYMDMYFNMMDLRLGKQQIVWGKADGVFITDIVSPKNLSEFLLPDFEEIRIGVTSLKLDFYTGDNTLEVVWIPIFTPTTLPENSSIWSVNMGDKLDLPVTPTFDYSKMSVSKKFRNSEIFTKYSIMTSLIDFEIMGGYAYNDDFTPHITKQINPATHQLTGITVTPEYHRVSIGGGSFSTTLLGVVLRGEGAYYNGKYFLTSDPRAADGVVPKGSVNYLVGLDFSLFDIKLSGQFIQQIILDYSSDLIDEEYQNTATALMRKTFFRETLRLELFGYFGLTDKDSLIRPKIYYNFADGFDLILGANIFSGDKGMFGQYNNNDMIYTKIKYSF